jgi:Holliday junction resolvase
MLERDYQKKLVKKLKEKFPGCIVMKNDAQLKQGIPDLLILYKDKWVALEVKNSEKAHHQPNQDIYVANMNNMSYAAFIFPENEAEVLAKVEEVFR